MKYRTMVALSLLCVRQVGAQQTFTLKNPSFEQNAAGAGQIPMGWLNLGSSAETPPDIQPGSFEVTLKPQHGDTYLGLVVRDNNSWEGVGQRLDGFLKKDSTYTFSVWLARSPLYSSTSRLTQKLVNYSAPTVLKIWGVNSKTNQEELLAESDVVSHSKWMLYSFTLKPSSADFDEIDLMAYYGSESEKKNGNLLIDHCSDIVLIPSD